MLAAGRPRLTRTLERTPALRVKGCALAASMTIAADTPEKAMQWAREFEQGDDIMMLDFQSYDSTAGVEHIEIRDANGATAAEWQSDDLLRRLAARDLLEALEQAVAALNIAPRFTVPGLGTDSYAIAAICNAAIRKAKPRAT